MEIQALIQIPFVKINQRFGNTATRTRKTRKHLERAERLLRIEMVVGVAEH